ncbi:uncharacterized protein LOC112686533 isoform X2 [Sipha flava]|uniref:Uncharacterized protein LOC112686533 isoform X2 n=1 Tax=Sipha flava TaxID=143950 RepID=A0A8B8FWD6_9HEMI|nr:uncharacterized protein LOC112686533 isoform X2 [Sipha flava]
MHFARSFELSHNRSMINMFKHILKPKSLVLWIVLFTLIIWTYTFYSLTAFTDVLNEHHSSILGTSGYLIKTPGCRIPEMYLNGPEVDKYMNYNEKLDCRSMWNYTLPLVTSNLTALILNATARTALIVTERHPKFECYYSAVKRPVVETGQDVSGFNENSVKLGEKVYFEDDVTVSDEMIEAICTFNGNVVYKDYHIFVRPAPAAMTRRDGDVNVLILGLDSVSRLNFHRQMPLTDALLSRLDNVEMLGYNKVEDNTFPNLVPLLAGLSVDELRNRCWPRDDGFFDECRFVWDDYKRANFSTTFAEDSPTIGTFNYLKPGFLGQPTDHYLRPIMLRAEHGVGHGCASGNTMCCAGGRLAMAALLDHALKITMSAGNRLHMGFYWSTSLTHDYVEYARFGDRDLAAFFAALDATGMLNNTVVLLMSDHGIRWGTFRDTYQGALEDRLPMLRFVVPEWYVRVHPAAVRNLRANANRLTTPYDVHETLLELADGSLGSPGSQSGRGVSLFHEVPDDRTCEAAGIPVHYCSCHDVRVTLRPDDEDAVRAANLLVHYANAVLAPYPRCANLTLHRVNAAAVQMGRDSASTRDYEVRVTTVPGLAKFEAVMREDRATAGRFKMVGSISRLNMYGNQSECVRDAKIKLLCYCVLGD